MRIHAVRGRGGGFSPAPVRERLSTDPVVLALRTGARGHAVGMLVSDAGALLTSRDAAVWAGASGGSLCRDVRARRLVRVDRGWYADPEDWHRLYAEDRHLLRVVAAHRRQTGSSPLVFSHVSAAVLWELPLWRLDPPRVHLSGITGGGHVRRSEPLVARHELTVPAVDITCVGGVRCTSLARTVADTIRSVPADAALAIADAALRRTGWDARGRAYDVAAASLFREEVARRLPRGGRGVRRARVVLEMADGRAESPGESVSRMHLHEIGFHDVRIQTRVAAPHGGWFALDFDLPEANAWGEFDGTAKYVDPAVRSADADRIVLEEKRREDWIRGTTQRRLARWDASHLVSASTLARRLAEFHIHPRA